MTKDRSRTWGARHYLVLVLAPMLVISAQAGCARPLPTQPPNVIVNNVTNVIVGGNPSASPAPGAASAVAAVDINGFADGELCPAGIAPADQTKTIRAGCKLAVTVNPKDAQGHVIHDTSVSGLAPDYFEQAGDSSSATFRQDGGNPYNGMIEAKKAGIIVLKAACKNVPSGDVTFTVIN